MLVMCPHASPCPPTQLTAGTLGVLVGNPTDVLKVLWAIGA